MNKESEKGQNEGRKGINNVRKRSIKKEEGKEMGN